MSEEKISQIIDWIKTQPIYTDTPTRSEGSPFYYTSLLKFAEIINSYNATLIAENERLKEALEQSYSREDLWECWQAAKHFFRTNGQPYNFEQWISEYENPQSFNQL